MYHILQMLRWQCLQDWIVLTGFNIMDEEFLTECFILGFPGNSKNGKPIIFCTLYAKFFIYLYTQNQGQQQHWIPGLPISP